MISKPIYLDHNATTPVDPRVLETMLPYFTGQFGNASSVNHAYGWEAEEAVSLSREQIAQLTGAKPNELFFTSGATEAINLAMFGVSQAYRDKGNHLITCATEHKAILDTCQQLEHQGYQVSYLKVDSSGSIDLEELKHTITKQTILISLMHANNETGVIHPLHEIAAIAQAHNVLLMTDATQSVGKISFNVDALGVDIAAFSAHKLYGPKGVGSLYLRKQPKVKIAPILFGGGQEKGLRPGTLNVPGIVGFGKACEICKAEMESESGRLKGLRDFFEKEISTIEGLKINGSQAPRLPHVSNFSIENIDDSKLLRSLKKLAVSQGSACSSVTTEPSHVLKSMGLPDELALSSIRIGFGRFTKEEEVQVAIDEIKQAVEQLRLTVS